MGRWHNVGRMLDHRLRGRPDISPALGQRLVFAGRRSRILLSRSPLPCQQLH